MARGAYETTFAGAMKSTGEEKRVGFYTIFVKKFESFGC